MIISIIAALAKNNVIGQKNKIPWHLPADFAYFKKMTLGKPVIMGAKTFESIGKPLPGRKNIVLHQDKNYTARGCTAVNSIEAALSAAGDAPEAMICGGASVYQQFLAMANRLYLTYIDHEFAGDAFFPEFDRKEWSEVSRENHAKDAKNPYPYAFVVLERKAVKDEIRMENITHPALPCQGGTMENMKKHTTIIGLEIHVQLKTKSKMFCSCDNDITERGANENICPICLGHPGVLPVANKQAIEWTVLTGLALHCEIPAISKFDRKNYFYPDLPKGYQISQYDLPIAVGGYLETGGKKVRIRRVHLEEDAAKNFHSVDKNYSLVDYNRSGTPLLEIVTEPDLETAKEAGDFLRQLRLIMRYLGVSNADMEKGELRCDANVNIKRGKEKTPIVEIKNLNSFKMVEAALAYEIKRQTEEFDALKNKKGKQTAGWDDQSGATRKQRQKEEAEDYRYFPEPDLPLFNLGEIAKVMARRMPELPDQRRARLAEEYGLKQEEINALVNNKTLGDYYEQVVSEALGDSDSEKRKVYKLAANWVVTELQKLLKASNTDISHLKITAENFGEFVNIVSRGEINSSAGQIALSEMFETGADPSQIIADKNLGQVNDVLELEKIAREVISENPKAVADFQSGNEKILMFLVGKVMAKTGGRANPEIAQKALRASLRGGRSKAADEAISLI